MRATFFGKLLRVALQGVRLANQAALGKRAPVVQQEERR